MDMEEVSKPNFTTTEVAPPPKPAEEPVAWWLHTVGLIALLLGSSFLGAGHHHGYARGSRHFLLYLFTIGWEWLLVGYVILGIRRRGKKLRDLIGGGWKSGSDVALDFAIALGFWAVSLFVLGTLAKVLGLGGAGALNDVKQKFGLLIPGNAGELALFVLVSMTAGFCEEVLCRGYLQRQFAAFTHNEGVAIALQAIVFGLGHGYQGAARMFMLTIYGAMFGALAYWRKSLRPGMISHAWQDTFSGISMYVLFVVLKR